MEGAIKDFRGKYYWLSNFSNSPIEAYFGNTLFEFDSVEQLFQAAKIVYTISENKSKTKLLRKIVELDSPGEAKRFGKKIANLNVKQWNSSRDTVMGEILRAKFSQNKQLLKKLLETEDAHLEEGNSWGDKYWGTVNGQGANKLGLSLMALRDNFRSAKISAEPFRPQFKVLTGKLNDDKF